MSSEEPVEEQGYPLKLGHLIMIALLFLVLGSCFACGVWFSLYGAG